MPEASSSTEVMTQIDVPGVPSRDKQAVSGAGETLEYSPVPVSTAVGGCPHDPAGPMEPRRKGDALGH